MRSGGSVALACASAASCAATVAAVGIARVQLPPQDVEHLGVDRNELIGRVDLAAQRRLGDGGDRHVRGEREVGRLDLKALRVGERLERFDGAAIEAPDVEGVRNQDLRGMEIVDAGARCRDRRQRRRRALVGRIEIGLDQREEFSLLGVRLLPSRRAASPSPIADLDCCAARARSAR